MMLPESLYEKFGVNFEPGQIIFCEYEPGNECYFILDGRIKITKTVGNAQKTLDVLQAGDFFGEMAILEEEPRSASAIAIDNIRALKFNRVNFDGLMNGQPQLAYRLMLIFAHRIFDQRRRLQILLLDDTQAKVSDVFCMLSEKDSHHGTSSEMVFNVTVDDVAAWCGLPPAEVQRVISGFVKQGKIELFADRIVIHNINDFSRLVAARRKSLI